MNLNPNHLVTRSLEGQWHKVLAILLWKFRDQLGDEVVITEEDVRRAFEITDQAVVCHARHDGLYLKIVPMAEAQRLAREHGGLPS